MNKSIDYPKQVKAIDKKDFFVNKGNTVEYYFESKRKPVVCKVNKITGCHDVISNKPRPCGYVTILIGDHITSKPVYIHRKVYTSFIGEIPKGMSVMHSCDNNICCNPAHLSCGTHRDNMLDKERKGRANNCKGNSSGIRVLSIQDVIFIKNNLDRYTDQEFAKIYGLVYQVFYSIRKGLNWKHVSKDDDPLDPKFGKERHKFTLPDVELICSYKMTIPQLAEMFGCSQNTISCIRRGELPKYLTKSKTE